MDSRVSSRDLCGAIAVLEARRRLRRVSLNVGGQ